MQINEIEIRLPLCGQP